MTDSEAKACYGALPPNYDATNYGRITKWAVRALQAKAQLFAGKYADAAISANNIIQNGDFSLKNYPYIQKFRNRAARLYASILFPYK